MRHKGFLGSFGTSALLVTAAVSILLTVSAIVAFEGWPGPTGDAPTETFLLERSSGGGDARPVPELLLEPPRAREQVAAADSAAGSGAASASAAEAAITGSPPASAAAPDVAVSPVGLTAAPFPGTGGRPTVGDSSGGGPFGGTVDRATGTIDEGAEGVAPVTDDLQDLVGGSTGSVNDLTSGR